MFTVASVVTLPKLVTSPLKLAFVVTVLALPVTFPVTLPVRLPVTLPVNGPTKPPAVTVPVVVTFCAPKAGMIFVPSIAAVAEISSLMISPLSIFAELIALLLIVRTAVLEIVPSPDINLAKAEFAASPTKI